MRSIVSIGLGVALFCAAGWSQTAKPSEDAAAAKTDSTGRASSPQPERRSSQPATRTALDSYSSSLWEYWINLTIPAGGYVDVDSGKDYSYSDTVRVTVRCNDGNLADVALAAYWTVPRAPYFNTAEVVEGSTFYYRNVGGATFNTYGSQFRLRILNRGAVPVTLNQVLLFARVLY